MKEHSQQTHEEFLAENCTRLSHGQCSTLNCLIRGGYKQGTPTDYNKASCPAYEIHQKLQEQEDMLTELEQDLGLMHDT